MALEDSQRLARLAAAGARLRIDGGTAEVLDRFDCAGVHAIMLKGPSIARWLYTDGTERPYNDCDLLVAPEQFDAAGRALRSIGYEPMLDRWGLPAWWYGHAVPWTHRGGAVGVDLHRTLIGVGVEPTAAWRVLSADTDSVAVAGRVVPCLGLPARAMHVALHAAQHGRGTQPALDLERAVSQGDDELWRRAAGLAAQLDAIAAFAAGLRLAPAGARLATRLALPDVRSVTTELRASNPPPLALGFEELARARTTRARAEIVWRNLAPRSECLRGVDLRAAGSRWRLALAYTRRLAWVARRAPAGLAAWYRVHRWGVRQDRR